MTYLTRANATLAYLAAVLLLGGASAEGFRANLFLQIGGAALIGWTLWRQPRADAARTGLARFGIAFAVLAVVQFLLLPPGIWQHLPGREKIYEGFGMLGVDVPWLTLSLAPWKSLGSLTWWIPAFAILISLRAEGAPPTRNVILTITPIAALSVLLGALQRTAGTGYIYSITNFGEGPGFFANSNHQGSFLLVALMLWGGHVASQLADVRDWKLWRDPVVSVQLAIAGLLVFGVVVSGSLACVLLLIPVIAALALIVMPEIKLSAQLVVGGGILLFGAIAAFLAFGPVANDLTARGATAGISRLEFLQNGLRMLADFAPVGSGLGTFQELYRWYEDPALVGTTFVNHAHNDLLELLIETGIFGLAALAVFLIWYLPRINAVWKGERNHTVALAASVAIGVMLVHSLVDYPLRTAAMSSMMAVCCVLLVRTREEVRQHRRRPTKKESAERDMVRI